VCVYSLCPSFPEYALIHDVAMRRPGIVLLHDLGMHHLYIEMLQRGGWDVDAYVDSIALHYGTAAARETRDRIQAGDWPPQDLERLSARQPLFEPAIAGALGVVVGSEHAAERVRSAWPGPVAALASPPDSAAGYANDLMRFIDDALAVTPVLDLAERAGRELGALGVSGGDEACGLVLDEMSRLLPAGR
jgi:hypothetical protein